MTREEKIKALENMTSFVAYPTVMTYDMGMEYEVISRKGFMGDWCKFERWPVFVIRMPEAILKLVESCKCGNELSLEDFKGTVLEEFVVEPDELTGAIELFKDSSLGDYLYVLEFPWETNLFFSSREKVIDAFFDNYGGVDTEWEDMDDDSIDYAYGRAEEFHWGCVTSVYNETEDDDEDEEDETNEEDEEIISEDADSLYKKAMGAAKLGRTEYANFLLEDAVRAGSAEAMNQLACNLIDGLGVPVDSKRGFDLWMKAAELGNAMAQYNVAIGYIRGAFTKEVDYNKSFEWCLKSALQGYPESIATIGQMYFYGHGVAQDYDKAFEWLNKGVSSGADGFFCFLLGYCYENGYGVNVDSKKAIELYIAAGDNEFARNGLDRLKNTKE